MLDFGWKKNHIQKISLIGGPYGVLLYELLLGTGTISWEKAKVRSI